MRRSRRVWDFGWLIQRWEAYAKLGPNQLLVRFKDNPPQIYTFFRSSGRESEVKGKNPVDIVTDAYRLLDED